MDPRIGKSHLARKELFRKGVRRGYLTVEEIEKTLPPGAMAAAERWLLYYSIRAAEIEIIGDVTETLERSDLEEPGESV